MPDGSTTLVAMEAPAAAPVKYKLKPNEAFITDTVFAIFDGTSAAGSYLPCCTLYSQDGRVLSRTSPGEVSAGDVVEVTYGPFLGLAGSGGGSPAYVVELRVLADSQLLAVTAGIVFFVIPAEFDGLKLTAANAAVTTASGAGTPTFQIRNETTPAPMLSTPITIDAGELTSYTAAVQPVVDPTEATVHAGDEIGVDVTVTGAGTSGLLIILSFG